MAHVARALVPLALLVACKGPDPDDTDAADCASPTVWYADVDVDGEGAVATALSACDAPLGYVASGRDCDDDDADVHPAAVEVCNDKDDDCDGVTDPDGAPGSASYWPDADGDGAGDVDGVPLQTCRPPEGFVVNNADCDDTTALAGPRVVEGCDGIDNDCDGVIDGTHAIPRDHATIHEAIAAAPDGELVCVGPGVFVGGLELVDRTLRIEGAGATETVIDADSLGSALVVDGGDVTLKNLGLQGGTGGSGAAVRVSDATLTLDQVNIGDMTLSVDSDALTGLIRTTDATVALVNVAVVGNDLRARKITGGVLAVAGAILHATDSDITWAGGEITSNLLEVALDETGGATTIDGLIAATGGALRLSDLVISGNTVIGRSVATLNAAADATVTGLLQATDAEVVFTGVEVVDNALRADATTPGIDGSRAMPQGWFVVQGGTLDWTDVLFDRNTSNALGLKGDVTAYGRVTGAAAVWTGVTFSANTLTYKVVSDTTCDGLLFTDSTLDASRLDVRANELICGSSNPPAIGRGILAFRSSDGGVTPSTATLTNVVFSGNSLTGRDVVRGPIVVDAASLTLDQATVHGNEIAGSFVDGGVVALYHGASLAVDHASVDGNVATAGSRLYGGVVYDAATGDDVDAVFGSRYTNWYDNATKIVLARSDGRTEAPSADDGNTTGPPGYVDVSGTDAADWDLHLSAASVLVDEGDPARKDADGSRADLGAYGGPGGAW